MLKSDLNFINKFSILNDLIVAGFEENKMNLYFWSYKLQNVKIFIE